MEQKNSAVEVQENDKEITEQNENKQGQSEEQGTQGSAAGNISICSFLEIDEILMKKVGIEIHNDEEKEWEWCKRSDMIRR